MSAKVLLRNHLAPSLAKLFLKCTFGVDAITDPIVDFLQSKLGDAAAAGDAARQFERLANASIEPLIPRFRAAKDLNPEAVAATLGETLEQHVDIKMLIGEDLDQERIHRALLSAKPLVKLKKQAYSKADIELYRGALPLLAEALSKVAPQLQGFELTNSAEVLSRLRAIGHDTGATRAGVERIELILDSMIRCRSVQERRYLHDYCSHIEQHLNAVQLFGITAETAVNRQKLSTAFIPLSLSHDGSRDERGGQVYFDTLLDRLSPKVPRLLLTGPAGSGKTTLLRWAAIQAATHVSRSLPVEDGSSTGTTTYDVRPILQLIERRVRIADPALRPMEEGAPFEPPVIDIADVWGLRVPFFVPLRYCSGSQLP